MDDLREQVPVVDLDKRFRIEAQKEATQVIGAELTSITDESRKAVERFENTVRNVEALFASARISLGKLHGYLGDDFEKTFGAEVRVEPTEIIPTETRGRLGKLFGSRKKYADFKCEIETYVKQCNDYASARENLGVAYGELRKKLSNMGDRVVGLLDSIASLFEVCNAALVDGRNRETFDGARRNAYIAACPNFPNGLPVLLKIDIKSLNIEEIYEKWIKRTSV